MELRVPGSAVGSGAATSSMMMSNCMQPNHQLMYLSRQCWYTLHCMPSDTRDLKGTVELHHCAVCSVRRQHCKWPLGMPLRFWINGHQTLSNVRSSHDACDTYNHLFMHKAKCASMSTSCTSKHKRMSLPHLLGHDAVQLLRTNEQKRKAPGRSCQGAGAAVQHCESVRGTELSSSHNAALLR